MADQAVPGLHEELPKHYLVRIELDGKAHFVVCEAIAAFDESRLFQTGINALRQAFQAFHADGLAEVAPLPPLGDARWIGQLATMEVGDNDGPD